MKVVELMTFVNSDNKKKHKIMEFKANKQQLISILFWEKQRIKQLLASFTYRKPKHKTHTNKQLWIVQGKPNLESDLNMASLLQKQTQQKTKQPAIKVTQSYPKHQAYRRQRLVMACCDFRKTPRTLGSISTVSNAHQTHNHIPYLWPSRSKY